MDQSPGIGSGLFAEEKPHKPRILVAPLDWGLGHATRSIPVIRELQNQGCEVLLAGEGGQEVLLKKEFPSLDFLPLAGYRVVYGRTRRQLLGNIFFQAPRILKTIKMENAWLKKTVIDHQIDGVISDNRFGLYHDNIPCVFMTHQLLIKTGLGNWMEKIVQRMNYKYINRFTECWVPDMEKEPSLAGELSHPRKLPLARTRYTGVLSRFKQTETVPRKDHLVIILSGPEPQRSLLENIMIQELGTYSATATVLRGLPDLDTVIPSTNMIRFYNHLPSDDIASEISSADYVISRSGYSTVMDMVKLKKRSILIPTPGQPEQEWLGKWLQEKKIGVCISQKDFTLVTALQAARKFDFQFPVTGIEELLTSAVADFLNTVIKKNKIVQAGSLG